MKKIIIAVALAAFAAPVLGQYTGGYGGALNDIARNELMRAQTQALNAYSRCLQTYRASAVCGPAPQMIEPTQPTYQRSIDLTCLDAMLGLGSQVGSAIATCSR